MKLLEIENKLTELRKEEERLKSEYEKNIKTLANEKSDLLQKQKIIMNNYNLDKIENARKFIYTKSLKKNFYGDASISLSESIKDCLSGFPILKSEYLGIKDYSGFIGQGIRCSYGRSPSYGSVMMRIGINEDYRYNKHSFTEDELDDCLYYLKLLKDADFRSKILKDGE